MIMIVMGVRVKTIFESVGVGWLFKLSVCEQAS